MFRRGTNSQRNSSRELYLHLHVFTFIYFTFIYIKRICIYFTFVRVTFKQIPTRDFVPDILLSTSNFHNSHPRLLLHNSDPKFKNDRHGLKNTIRKNYRHPRLAIVFQTRGTRESPVCAYLANYPNFRPSLGVATPFLRST